MHLTPHAAVDVTELGADFFACSPYKFFGPHHGVVVADPALLETLHPDKLLPSSDAVPERFELGTLPYELMAGTTATVDFIAGLVPGEGSRRDRVVNAMTVVEEHEAKLFARLHDGLGRIDGVTLHGNPARRTPTALFSVDGRSGREVYEHLATARRERAGRELLRDRGVAVDGARRRRRRTSGPRAVHERRGRGPPAGGRRRAEPLTDPTLCSAA